MSSAVSPSFSLIAVPVLLIGLLAGFAVPVDHFVGRPSGELDLQGFLPIGIWHHRGSDPFLGPFEEIIVLHGIGTFRSEIYAPAYDPGPIMIRGFWRPGLDGELSLYVSYALITRITFDRYDDSFIQSDGYRYHRITPEAAREIRRGWI